MLGVLTSGWTAAAYLSKCTRVRIVDLTADGIIFRACESNAHKKRRGTRTDDVPQDVHTRHYTDKQHLKACHSHADNGMLKMLTRYLKATASATNQNKIMRPDMLTIKTQDL